MNLILIVDFYFRDWVYKIFNVILALQRSGLDEFIIDDEDWTIFAPTNKAFDNLDPVFQNQLYDGNSSCAISINIF